MRNILPILLIIALLCGMFFLVQRLARQELTRVTEASTQQSACLMWQPRFLRGDGICALEIQDAQGAVVDTVTIGTVGSGFDALQKFGNIDFQGDQVTVMSRTTGESVRRFQLRDGRLNPTE